MPSKRAYRNVATVLASLLLAVTFGPIITAAASAWYEEDKLSPQSKAQNLLDVARPATDTMYSLSFTDWQTECGYQAENLFPYKKSKNYKWPSSEDLYLLHSILVNRLHDDEDRSIKLRRLQVRFSPFEMDFLRSCIANSLFSPVCSDVVEKVLTSKKPLPPQWRYEVTFKGVDRELNCRYLDGEAARRGFPLSDWPSEPNPQD